MTKMMELTITITATKKHLGEDDLCEMTNDLENLELKDKLQSVVQNMLDEFAIEATVTVEE